MNFTLKTNYIHFIILLVCLTACHDKEALKDTLIEETVKNKVESFKRKKISTCTEEVINAALILADSLMIQLALNKVDTNSQIKRPIKPARPAIDLPVDTTPIKPLFEDTISKREGALLEIDTFENSRNDTLSNGN